MPRHPYTRLLLSAVPDPDRPFVPGDSARFLGHAEEVRRLEPAGVAQVEQVGPNHFVRALGASSIINRTTGFAWTISSICRCFRPTRTRCAAEERRRHHPPGAGAGTGAGHQLGPRKIQRRLVERDGRRLCAPAASCFLATRSERLVGFACHDSIARGFFGPTGVDEAARGAGIGHALLLATLLDMRTLGYGYAIIGDVGPSAFYERTVGATPIPNSEPGVYAGLLKQRRLIIVHPAERLP